MITIQKITMDTNNPLSILRDMLKQKGIDDPQLQQFLEKETETSKTKQEEADTNKESLRRLRIQNKKLLEQVALLKDLLRQTHLEKKQVADNASLIITRTEELAEATGSCAACWGEKPDCPVCQGQGLPGWKPVTKKYFNTYILPCLEKLYGLSR